MSGRLGNVFSNTASYPTCINILRHRRIKNCNPILMTSAEIVFYLILFPFFLAPNFSYCQDHTVSELGPSKSNPTCARRSRMAWSHIWIHLWLARRTMPCISINLTAKRSTRPGFTLNFYVHVHSQHHTYIYLCYTAYTVCFMKYIYVCISIHILFLSL